MASWVVCPGCSLKHSARPDGVCPRCKKPVEAGAAESAPLEAAPVNAPPTPLSTPPRPPPTSAPNAVPERQAPFLLRAEAAAEEEKAPLGARLAGAIMVLNGLALVAESSLGMAEATKIGSQTTSSPTRLIFAFVLGGFVLAGSAKAVKVARVLVGISAVVLPAILLSQSQTLLAVLQLAFSTSLLLLLFGDAGRVRMGIALALAGIFFSMEGAGLYGTVSGHFPLARLMMASQLEPGPVADVTGSQVSYRLTAPGSSWYLRTDAAAHKDNALADRWLIRPDRDAHVMVIAETLPDGSVASMERFRATVVANLTKNGKKFTVVDEEEIATSLEEGHLVHARSELNGQPMEWVIGLYIHHPYIFQVLAFSNGRAFPDVESEVRSIVTSLSL